MGAALILCRVARACARRSMPPDMMAADFCSAHGAAFVEWLRANTQECKCTVPYKNDESRQRGDVITDKTEILCRRCFVPVAAEKNIMRRVRGPVGAGLTTGPTGARRALRAPPEDLQRPHATSYHLRPLG